MVQSAFSHVLSVVPQNDVSKRLLDMMWLRIDQFLPNFLLTPPQSTPSKPTHPPPPPSHSPAPSQQPPQETVAIQEVQVTMATEHATGGISMATIPLPASRSPTQPPEISPHASPPTNSSPGEWHDGLWDSYCCSEVTHCTCMHANMHCMYLICTVLCISEYTLYVSYSKYVQMVYC